MNRLLLGTVAVVLLGACGSDNAIPPDAEPFPGAPPPVETPTDENDNALQAALERVPFEGGFPDYTAFPPEQLLDHLQCTKEVTDGESPALASIASKAESRSVIIAYADCAIEAGLGSTAEIWQPTTEAEEREYNAEVLADIRACLEAAGYDPMTLPVTDSGFGDELDFEALYVMDPAAEQELFACDPYDEEDL